MCNERAQLVFSNLLILPTFKTRGRWKVYNRKHKTKTYHIPQTITAQVKDMYQIPTIRDIHILPTKER